MLWPPKGIVLETPAQIAHEARRIYLQAGLIHAMPPANLSDIKPQEREAIVRWYRGWGRGQGWRGRYLMLPSFARWVCRTETGN